MKEKSNIEADMADVPMFYCPILCKFCHDFTHKISRFLVKTTTFGTKIEMMELDSPKKNATRYVKKKSPLNKMLKYCFSEYIKLRVIQEVDDSLNCICLQMYVNC